MQLLTKQTDYAVRALINLALTDFFKDTGRISQEEQIPYPFLRKILQKLSEENYVETKKGLNGGVRLAKPVSEITLTRLIELFQGEIELSSCMFRKKICDNRKKCVLRKKIKSIEKMVVEEFSGITIADLVKEAGGK